MSKIIGHPLYAPAPAGGGKPSVPKFTYDGDYVIRDDGVVELLTSGTLVFLNPTVIDLFMVGGGSSGAYQVTSREYKYTGGSGGYTRTIKRVAVSKGVQIPVTIGAGGIQGSNGGSSAFNEFTVNGGTAPSNTSSGAGGSGGGAGGWSTYGKGGTGGSDGSDGVVFDTGFKAGSGQGFTTREFGETNGKLYAGGGGGATYLSSSTPPAGGAGGDGGGGKGASCGKNRASNNVAGTSGVANTGGGGGGGGRTTTDDMWIDPGNGGSGIVCFREAQELPELAGTWVLNERLYAPEFGPSAPGKQTTQAVTFTAGPDTFTAFVFFWPSVADNNMYYQNKAKTIGVYNFVSNTYFSGVTKTITFPPDATASEEFHTWLASNATKQTA